jgi:hypothetical protein
VKIIIRRDGGFNRQESIRATSRPSEGTSKKMSGYATARDLSRRGTTGTPIVYRRKVRIFLA